MMRCPFVFVVFLMAGVVFLVPAQDRKARPQLSTPQQTVRTHLLFLQADYQKSEEAQKYLNYSIKALRNPRLDPATIQDLPELALQLKEIYDGLGVYIEVDQVPDTNNYRDTLRQNRSEYVVMVALGQEMYLEKVGAYWYYSVESIKSIPLLHAQIYVVNLSQLLRNLGVPLSWEKPAKILVFFLLTLLTYGFLSLLFNRFLVRLAKRLGYLEIIKRYIAPLARPASIFLTLLLMNLLLPSLGIPPKPAAVILLGFRFLIPLFGILMVYRLVIIAGEVFTRLASRTETTLDDQLVPLLTKTLKVAVVILGGLLILQEIGIDTDRFWTGISIGGLAFALAAQDTIKNFFGSIMIFVDRPFQIGDWIISGEINGTVEEIGFRSTRVRTFEDAVTSVPNGRLADATIQNMGQRRSRRFRMHIALTYDTPPHVMEAYIWGLRKLADEHPSIIPGTHRVYFNQMGDFSLNILFQVFLHVKDFDHELIAKEELLLAFLHLAQRLGVRFAFPTSTIHVEEIPGQESLTPSYGQTSAEFEQKARAFFQEYAVRHRSKEEIDKKASQ
ncbi:MAG: mechanosensitive ion channel family protein [Bernardetiaceae bacterium]